MEVQIEMANKLAVKNFVTWFKKEGFESFSKSKYNKLVSSNTDSFVTCLATDEQLTTMGDEYAGHFFELQ